MKSKERSFCSTMRINYIVSSALCREAKREKEGKNQLDLGPSEDFSLKEGQKIKIPTVNVKRKKDKEGRKGKSGGIAAPSSSGKSSSGSQPTSQSGDGSDDWVSF
eukprot:gb/GECG01015999.1/.p1 GENE.gb/GECG01015999.1/~~gb/GECG01015999.1/.p1  ORF type:complete len:105 (+),score=20.57 gb/GECG01015999.1/:1-315(+)